jgi:hypothetical protein
VGVSSIGSIGFLQAPMVNEINVATAKARAAVGAELMEKIDSISGGLKHVEAGQGVEGKPRTLMQDIRDAGGKTKKSQGRE